MKMPQDFSAEQREDILRDFFQSGATRGWWEQYFNQVVRRAWRKHIIIMIVFWAIVTSTAILLFPKLLVWRVLNVTAIVATLMHFFVQSTFWRLPFKRELAEQMVLDTAEQEYRRITSPAQRASLARLYVILDENASLRPWEKQDSLQSALEKMHQEMQANPHTSIEETDIWQLVLRSVNMQP